MTRGAAVATVAVLALLLPGTTRAKDAKDGRDGKLVKKIVDLTPTKDAEVVIPSFRLLEHEDGSVTLSGEGTANVLEGKTGFDYVVDRRKGTYSTKKVDPATIEERSTDLFESGEATPDEPAAPGDEISAFVWPGYHSGRVRVVTRDPAFITLTETSTALTWYVYTSGSIVWTNYSDGCWAANPSALGTHWYTAICGYGWPWYASMYYACNANSGRYYNWDFWSNTQITEVAQTAQMCGRNDAYYDYWWSHNDAGEAAYLIFGSVFLN